MGPRLGDKPAKTGLAVLNNDPRGTLPVWMVAAAQPNRDMFSGSGIRSKYPWRAKVGVDQLE